MTACFKSLLYAIVFAFSIGAAADGGGDSSFSEYGHLPDDFDQATEAIESEDFSMAIKQLRIFKIPGITTLMC